MTRRLSREPALSPARRNMRVTAPSPDGHPLHAPMPLPAPRPPRRCRRRASPMPTPHADAAADQPRAVAARVQPARAGARRRIAACRCSSGCASCASSAATSTSSSRSASPASRSSCARRSPPPGMTLQEARDAVRADRRRGARAGRRPVPRAQRRRCCRRSAAAGVRLVRRTEFTAAERAWAAKYFAARGAAAADADRARSGASVPAGRQQEPQFRRSSCPGSDAFGRDTGDRDRQGAARAAARSSSCRARSRGGDNAFVMLSSVIHAHLHELFPGREVVDYSQFRVTRDADLWIDEEEVKNLRQALQGELPQRQFGSPCASRSPPSCPRAARAVPAAAVRARPTPTSTAATGRSTSRGSSSLVDQVDIDALKYRAVRAGHARPAARRSRTSWPRSAQHDILLHHPYQSFEPVVEFIRRAADDPDVVAIKQTVYRTGVNSVLMEALIEAARARQGSHGRRRADGALRRGGEHQLGRAARARRRAGRLRRVRPEDARQARAAHPPRARRARAARGSCPTRTSAPATTIRARRASTPTSAC